ncbi:tellurite resistance TerB family protein [Nocardia terpenica]|uniref:Tellurite resistance TerB n=1 Tax=Nocardia terpenica TaxID=455432 RepID=A0A291RI02_9NOCA|nr:TerB family tellurite resistance protein [Nocardia terpenica]ATL67007.1 Tellurite resistance TerB [Nocardia terpenica]MBF6066267.1 tellurite resistance TerB family protein [Nocardia terpenica]MBF6109313.1 tellurite resistance TerB family protein [Nocardia terpenica]MBF6116565.1 tellurite resistance TerB family protein [Nocardia terpenica]MBF6123614.1 tellurite resistance TerB family protein [Nocardia terpenica]
MSFQHEFESVPDTLRDSSFRDAAVGICALVSAIGGADPAERVRVADRIEDMPVLHHFPPYELRNLFEDNWHRLALDPAFGRAYVLQQVARATDRPAQARAAVRTGIEITGADRPFGPQGADVLRECCRVLHLAPAEFGL